MSETTISAPVTGQPLVASHLANGEPVPAVKGLDIMISRGPRAGKTGQVERLNAAGTRAYVQLRFREGYMRVALCNLETSPYA